MRAFTFAVVSGFMVSACTVVAEPSPDGTRPEDVTAAEIETPPDDVPADLPPPPLDTTPADVPAPPADLPVGPTDLILPTDSASDAATDSAGPTDTTVADTGPTLPPFELPTPTRWRLVFEDDFNGAPCDPDAPETCASPEDLARAQACFGTRAAPVDTLLLRTFHPNPNDATHTARARHDHLSALDKCVWAVSEHVNSRHFVGSAGPIMRYDPAAVEVTRGELRLTTRRTPGWSAGTNDCGRKINPSGPSSEENLTRSCEYEGANVVSQPFLEGGAASPDGGLVPGAGRTFPRDGATGGRLEVRARLPGARGNIPILSTWPSVPGAGEVELTLGAHTINEPGVSQHRATIYGAGRVGAAGARHAFEPAQAAALQDEFHVYGVDWRAGGPVALTLNGLELARFPGGTQVSAGGTCISLQPSGNPVHLMLRNILSQYDFAPGAGPEGGAQMHDTLHIDWVRYWEPCADDDDDPACVASTVSSTCGEPCGRLGVLEREGCFVGEVPDGTQGAVSENYLGYRPGTGLDPCPRGGIRLEGICALVAVPEGRVGIVDGGRMFVDPVCSPSATLVNCGAPCPVEGTRWEPEHLACFYREAIPGTNPFVYANTLYYSRIEGDPAGPCPYGGSFDGANCVVGQPPAGHVAKLVNGDYYLEPHACPDGGTWDRELKACLLKEFPGGTAVFGYAGGLYYSTPTPGTCSHGGGWDGANCRWRDIPVGTEALVLGTKAYFRAQCTQSTNWGGLAVYPASVTVEGTPCP